MSTSISTDANTCRRCGEASAAFHVGPLLGLCRVCIENDHIGTTAALEVTTRERDEARRELEETRVQLYMLGTDYDKLKDDSSDEIAAIRDELAEARRELEARTTEIAKALGLVIPAGYDATRAIVLDIGRLNDVSRAWDDACALARKHCPVSAGESHVRQGIPRLAARLAAAEQKARTHGHQSRCPMTGLQVGCIVEGTTVNCDCIVAVMTAAKGSEEG